MVEFSDTDIAFVAGYYNGRASSFHDLTDDDIRDLLNSDKAQKAFQRNASFIIEVITSDDALHQHPDQFFEITMSKNGNLEVGDYQDIEYLREY